VTMPAVAPLFSTNLGIDSTLDRPDRNATDSEGDPVAFRRFGDGVTVKVAYVIEAGVHVIKTVVCRPGRGR